MLECVCMHRDNAYIYTSIYTAHQPQNTTAKLVSWALACKETAIKLQWAPEIVMLSSNFINNTHTHETFQYPKYFWVKTKRMGGMTSGLKGKKNTSGVNLECCSENR